MHDLLRIIFSHKGCVMACRPIHRRATQIAAAVMLAGGVVALPVRAVAVERLQSVPLVRVDWQEPLQLPPQFRNHCSVENFTRRPFCSNHCGGDYQFYYCSEASFGCCHLGHGYCDFTATLRCHP